MWSCCIAWGALVSAEAGKSLRVTKIGCPTLRGGAKNLILGDTTIVNLCTCFSP